VQVDRLKDVGEGMYSARRVVRRNPATDLPQVKRKCESPLDEAADVIAGGRSLRIYTDATVHDRWFVVDDQSWHSGGSLKDLGRKVTRISEVDEWEIEKHELLLASLATPANLVVIPRKQAP
jgi:hypothetical protein